MFQTKVVQKIKTHILCSVILSPPPQKNTVYELMCIITVEPGRPQMTICWIPKTTKTHSEYVIFMVFPLRQWLSERASILRYAYIACLVDCSSLTCFDADGSSSVRNH